MTKTAQIQKSKATLVSNASVLMERARAFGSNFNSIFRNKRDLSETFGYPKEVTYELCLALYSRGGLARRVVRMPAEAIWSKPPIIISPDPKKAPNQKLKQKVDDSNTGAEDEDDEDAEDGEEEDKEGKEGISANEIQTIKKFAKTWKDIFKEFDASNVFTTADCMAGMGSYSVVLLGFDDVKRAEDLTLPARMGSKLTYLRAYSYYTATIDEYEGNPTSVDYGKPKIYTIDPSGTPDEETARSVSSLGKTKTMGVSAFKVHASRVVHITDDALDNELFGYPRMVNVYNNLLDTIKVVGGAAETYWLTGNRGLHIDVDKDIKMTPEDASNLSDEVDEYLHGLSRVLRTRGISVDNIGSDVADPSGTFKTLIAVIAGSTGIPQRSLIGAEAGQLASEQDRANWADYVESRRERVAEPVYLKPFIKKLQAVGYLPNVPYKLLWPEAYKMDPLQRSQAAAQKARVLANVTKALPEGEFLATRDELREVFGLNDTRIGE